MSKKIPFIKFVTLQRGFDLPNSNRKAGEVPVVASTGISGYHNEYKVESPGVVTGRSGSLGTVQYITEDFWPLNTSLWVRNFRGNLPRYVYYYLQTMGLERYNSGAGVPTLNRNDLDAIEINIHDYPEQRKIVAVLSAYDDLIENNNRRIAILEEMAQKLYREWFLHFRFPGYENVQMVESEMGLIPDGWEVCPFTQAVEMNPKYKKPDTSQFSFVDMAGLDTTSMIISIKEQKSTFSGSKFSNGDTLVARITPCLENGKTGFVQCLKDGEIGSGSTEFIVLQSKRLSPEIVYIIARQNDFRDVLIKSMSGASGRQRANANALNEYMVCVPPGPTIEAFSAFANPVFNEIEQLHRKNANLRKTRDLLLPRLISGDIDISELDIPIKEG